MNSFTIRDLSVGQKHAVQDTITKDVVEAFAKVTGDHNPIHLDPEYAAKTKFGKNISHGMILAGFISKVLGQYLPGEGAVYAKQTINFRAPVFFDGDGETITTEVEVKEIIHERNRVILATTCRNSKGEVVADGEALMLPRKA